MKICSVSVVTLYLLVQLGGGPVRVCGAHPPVAVNGLVGGGGQHQQLVPLVGQQPGVDLNGNLIVEWKLSGPVNELEDNPVPDTAQLV